MKKNFGYLHKTKAQYFYSKSLKNFSYINPRPNFFINICSQNENIVIERLGKFKRVQKPGIFIAIPFIDKLKYCIDSRELTVQITPQHSITQDNVSIDIGGVVYMRFVDPYKVAYGVSDPIFAVSQFAQSAMRAIVGKNSLDEIFHNRENLNNYIITSLTEASVAWGVSVLRYEITDIQISGEVKEAMSRQASAERKRREDVLHAEALKRSQILESEGLKQKLINESEGRKIQVENEAQAQANSIRIKGDADKYAIVKNAEALAESLNLVGKELNTDNGQKAAQIQVATRYIEEFGKVVGKSNNIIIPSDVNDVSGFISKALGISNFMTKNNKV
jgi:regulator of protease activity HflC (stomatin/prohibitin superfamily)